MTRRLYLDDAYLQECEAIVESAENNRIVLDQTVLYAQSGGQAPDHGVLRWEPGFEAKVVDSQVAGGAHGDAGPRGETRAGRQDPSSEIVHVLEGPVPARGTKVQVVLDWERRLGLMRHHTAAHVIAAVVYRDFNAKFTGGQLYPDRARLDCHFDSWNPEMLKQIEAACNAEIEKGYSVKNYEISREEFEKGDLLRTAENLVDPAVERIRITDIVGLDAQADGGTHVRNTRDVGRIVMDKADNKGKGHRRISYHCE